LHNMVSNWGEKKKLKIHIHRLFEMIILLLLL
ncbi:hypothetical protein TorRG33x02_069010, partial [Trema orientale]